MNVLYLSPRQILEVKKAAQDDVAHAQKRVSFALTFVGRCADHFGAYFVRRMNQRLADSLVRIRGIVALVADIDPDLVMDSESELGPHLDQFQDATENLHVALVKARDDVKLRRTHEGFREGVELCVALQVAIGALKKAIADHDAKAAMGADTRRLMADLRRTDDVPAGRYAELAAAMRNVQPRERRAAR